MGSMFSTGTRKVWRQFSREVGAEYEEGGLLEIGTVRAHVGPLTVSLDLSTFGRHHLTRIRAPYVNPEGFRFRIYRKTVFDKLGKLLGMQAQNIQVGYPEFDEAFVIKANNENRVRELLSDKIRLLLQNQPRIRLEVKHSEGWLGTTLPADVDELYFQEIGVVNDIERLKGLFDLFAAVLDRLCKIGAACKQAPGVEF